MRWMSLLLACRVFPRPSGSQGLPRGQTRLRLEALEDRLTPANLVVTTLADDGSVGTLRAAMSAANAATGPTDITFAPGLSGTITLLSGPMELSGQAGEIDIDGAGQITVSGDNASDVFVVDSGVTAEFDNLTITQARGCFGGGIANYGALTVTGSTLSDGVANYGAAIYNAGTLTVTGSSLSDNSSSYGGAIYNNGALTLTSSALSGSSAFDGCAIDNSGTLALVSSTLSGNGGYEGGAISNTGTLMVTGSTLSNNGATYGGDILNDGTLTVTSSTLSGNSANYGGGIDNNATLTLTSSTLSGNTASHCGGGIANSGILTVADSTLDGNTANYAGGGINNTGTLTLTSSTLSGNTALDGAGISNVSGTLMLTNSIVVGNTSTSGSASDIAGSAVDVADSYSNLIGADETGSLTNGGNGNLVGVSVASAGLATLGDSGGPTQTIALLPGSIALGAGDPSQVPVGLTTDQRGFARVVGGSLDIGAFRTQAAVQIGNTSGE